MSTEKNIAIASANGITIDNVLFQSRSDSSALVVVFPGMGYSCEMPLLYYCTETALQAGCDVLNLKYFFQCSNARHDNTEEAHRQIFRDCHAAIKRCMAHAEQYRKIIFASKSIGTVFAAETALLLDTAAVSHFFLTPVDKLIPHVGGMKCTVVVGDNDPHCSADNISAMRALPACTLHVLAGMDHSLENPLHYGDSIKALAMVTDLWVDCLHTLLQH